MHNWFRRQGYPESIWAAPACGLSAAPSVASASTDSLASVATTYAAETATPTETPQAAAASEQKETLLIFDFDKTLTDYDCGESLGLPCTVARATAGLLSLLVFPKRQSTISAPLLTVSTSPGWRRTGERVVGELAPELVPQLAALETPANFVPLTNDVLGEMQRRGVSRDKLLTTLQLLGGELPGGTVRMLQWAKKRRVDVKVLSDCNSVFILHVLAGAKVSQHVAEVITNAASFERVEDACGAAALQLGAAATPPTTAGAPAKSASHRLRIAPRHASHLPPHGCALCPANLCKGAEVSRIQAYGQYRRIVYAGDGLNDVCPALRLGADDVLLARSGHPLAVYLQAAGAGQASAPMPKARVVFWDTHEQLEALVKEHAR